MNNNIALEFIATPHLNKEYEQLRSWLANNTISPLFEEEHQRWKEIEKEIESRNKDKYYRLTMLHNVLEQTAETGYFTIGERICINQERGYLFSKGSYEELRPYQVPETIENKIKKLI